jgi:hypothetical protein
MVGAKRHYISDAKRIEKDAPEILDHVKQGKLSAIGWDSAWGIEGGERAASAHRTRHAGGKGEYTIRISQFDSYARGYAGLLWLPTPPEMTRMKSAATGRGLGPQQVHGYDNSDRKDNQHEYHQ